MVENDEPLPTLWYTKMAHTHSIYCIYKDPQMWNLEGLPLLVQFCFSKMLVLNNFWRTVAHNPRFKRENNLHTQNWMVENDEPLPTLWYTKMAHTHTPFTAYRSPIVEFARAVFWVQFFLSRMLVLNNFWRTVARSPKLEGGRSLSSQLDGWKWWAFAHTLVH